MWLRYGCSPQPDRVVDSLEFGGITDHSDYQHLVPLYLERQHLIDGPIECEDEAGIPVDGDGAQGKSVGEALSKVDQEPRHLRCSEDWAPRRPAGCSTVGDANGFGSQAGEHSPDITCGDGADQLGDELTGDG